MSKINVSLFLIEHVFSRPRTCVSSGGLGYVFVLADNCEKNLPFLLCCDGSLGAEKYLGLYVIF